MSTTSAAPHSARPARLRARAARSTGLAAASRGGRPAARPRGPGPAGGAAEWPAWVDPSVYAACAGAGVTHPVVAPARGRRPGPRRVARRHGDRHGVGQVPGLPPAGASAPSSRAREAPTGRGATALYLSPTKALAADQLARVQAWAVPGVRAATYDGDTADRGAALDPRPRPAGAHQPRPRPPLAAARARALGAVPAGAALRRRRRVPRLPRGLRLAPGGGAAPPAPGLRAVRRPPHLRPRLGDGARPRASTPPGWSDAGAPVTEDGSPREAMTFALWEPGELPDGSGTAAARHLRGGRPAGRPRGRPGADGGVRPVAGGGRGAGHQRPPDPRRDVAGAGGGRRGLPRRLPARGAARAGALAAQRASSWGWPRPTPSSSASTSAGSTPCCWPAGRARGRRVAAGRTGRAGRDAVAGGVRRGGRPARHLRRRTTPRWSSTSPSRPRCSTPTTRTCSARTWLPPRPSCRCARTTSSCSATQARPLLDALVAHGILRRRPNGGWYWARSDRATDHVSLRGAGEVVGIVEQRTGRVLGTIDEASAHTPGAHRARSTSTRARPTS